MTNDVFTREWSKDVMTPQNPLGVAGRAVPGEDEYDHYDDDRDVWVREGGDFLVKEGNRL